MTEYWRTNSELRHLTPPGVRWPEGGYFATFLRDLFRGRSVIEFGCGDGRLAPAFKWNTYKGVDINATAVRAAIEGNPWHDFELWDGGHVFADDILCHTVLLHVSDDELDDVVGHFQCDRLIISEIMGRHLRVKQDKPPVFNREERDYIEAVKPYGYEHIKSIRLPYEHYEDTQLTMMEFRRD